MKKITITGTKGKTTISNVLAQVLCQFEGKVLNVDTNGAFLNGKLVISKSQSQLIWDVVPTVSPGRFLYLLNDTDLQNSDGLNHANSKGVAILEASLGCGTLSGLGYYGHDVGVFTNVYEDHLGSRPDLNNRSDIGKSKNFIFSRINRGGYAVFNADDDVVCSNIVHCKEGVNLIPFGVDFKHFNLAEHLDDGGVALTARETKVVLLSSNSQKVLFDYADISWMFKGKFTPSIYNLLAIVGALMGYNDGTMSNQLIESVKKSRLDPKGGRLTLLKNKDNVTILADYAHEKQSLKSVAELAHKLKENDENQVIGVVRLTWDRTEDLIKDTAKHISKSYDSFVVYDKIDGYWRKPSDRFRTNQRQFTQEVGKISKILAEALLENCGHDKVARLLREDEAVVEASKQAKSGDVVVVIVNDNIERSIDFIKESFDAELA